MKKWVWVGSTLLAGSLGVSPGVAQESQSPFADPVRVRAGDQIMGDGRYFPSPVFHDVNGDGRLDLVVGDLRGLITVALREPGDGGPRFGAEAPLKAADDEPLKFHNW